MGRKRSVYTPKDYFRISYIDWITVDTHTDKLIVHYRTGYTRTYIVQRDKWRDSLPATVRMYISERTGFVMCENNLVFIRY